MVIQLRGGLGNQMFQYAIGKVISIKNSDKLLIDVSFLSQFNESVDQFDTPRNYNLNIFNSIKDQLLKDKSFYKLFQNNKNRKVSFFSNKKYSIYSEFNHMYNDEVLSLKSPVYLEGYFQNINYFNDYSSVIRNLFSFSHLSLNHQNTSILNRIRNSNSVSIHVRRTDYLKAPALAFHGVCSNSYYKSAIDYIFSKIEKPQFYIFTDDPVWANNEFLKSYPDFILVDHNFGENSWVDMYLMSVCKHNIIANSSFSWWSAYLNENTEKIVVAPSNWFANHKSDIVPNEWIKI